VGGDVFVCRPGVVEVAGLGVGREECVGQLEGSFGKAGEESGEHVFAKVFPGADGRTLARDLRVSARVG